MSITATPTAVLSVRGSLSLSFEVLPVKLKIGRVRSLAHRKSCKISRTSSEPHALSAPCARPYSRPMLELGLGCGCMEHVTELGQSKVKLASKTRPGAGTGAGGGRAVPSHRRHTSSAVPGIVHGSLSPSVPGVHASLKGSAARTANVGGGTRSDNIVLMGAFRNSRDSGSRHAACMNTVRGVNVTNR